MARFRHRQCDSPAMRALFLVIDLALELYIWIVIALYILPNVY